MTFQIEDGVPIPSIRRRHTSEFVETIKSLRIGQSFLAQKKSPASANGAIQRIKLTHDGNFAVRPEGDGCRIWRVS